MFCVATPLIVAPHVIWLSAYLPLVRLRNFSSSTFLAIGMLVMSQNGVELPLGAVLAVTTGVAGEVPEGLFAWTM